MLHCFIFLPSKMQKNGGTLGQEHHKFKTSLENLARPYQEK
jgi:hypothetical protein